MRPFPPAASIAARVADAAWLAHRYDPIRDAVQFLPVTRTEHGAATFVTDDYLPAGRTPLVIDRREAIAVAPSPAPLHFVIHAAFCCSTMLARAFDRPGWAMGLKEPMIFNDLAGWRRRGGAGPDLAEVLDDMLTLTARPFGVGEAVVVKPSNVVHALVPAMLTLRPASRAVLLYAPLGTYLGSIARKGLDGRLWVRTLLLSLIDDKLIDLGLSTRDCLGLTDLQVAGVGWLAQQQIFAALIARFGAERVRALDSATLTADPARAMRALAGLYDLPLDDATLREIATGPAFTRHSKLDAAFDGAARDVADRAGQTVHADELAKVTHWTELLARTMEVTLPAEAALLPASGKTR